VDSIEAYRAFKSRWDKSRINIQEQFCALFLNKAGELIKFRVISTGQNFTVDIDQKFLFRCAVDFGATSVITAHNHPSGDVKPSDEDEASTRLIREEARGIGIELFDDLIISESDFYSMADNSNTAFTDELYSGEKISDGIDYAALQPKTKRSFVYLDCLYLVSSL